MAYGKNTCKILRNPSCRSVGTGQLQPKAPLLSFLLSCLISSLFSLLVSIMVRVRVRLRVFLFSFFSSFSLSPTHSSLIYGHEHWITYPFPMPHRWQAGRVSKKDSEREQHPEAFHPLPGKHSCLCKYVRSSVCAIVSIYHIYNYHQAQFLSTGVFQTI